MFKTRARKAEEEAKKQEDYIPTKDLEADEEKPEYHFPWLALIIGGGLLVIVVVLIIVIFALGGPVNK